MTPYRRIWSFDLHKSITWNAFQCSRRVINNSSFRFWLFVLFQFTKISMPQYYECDCSSPAIVALSSVLFVFVRRPAVQWRSTASVTYIPLYTSSIVTIETTNIPIQQKKDYFIPSFLFIIHIELIQWNTWSIFALNVCIFSKSFQYIIIMIIYCKIWSQFELNDIVYWITYIYLYLYILSANIVLNETNTSQPNWNITSITNVCIVK